MEFSREFSVIQDGEFHQVFANIVFKKVDVSFNTGLGYTHYQERYEIKSFECFCDTKKMNYNLEQAVLEKYERVFMRRDIDSIEE